MTNTQASTAASLTDMKLTRKSTTGTKTKNITTMASASLTKPKRMGVTDRDRGTDDDSHTSHVFDAAARVGARSNPGTL